MTEVTVWAIHLYNSKMHLTDTLLYETDTDHGHYQVWDMDYGGRSARVLYSGHRQAAQSGIARDHKPELLFDYNQRFYELVSALLPARMLLVGGGMYTLPTALLPALPSLQIDVVEVDAGLDDIASRYFDLKPSPRLHIIHMDGREYLDDNKKPYDLILVDAFSHEMTPSSLSSLEAAAEYKRNLKPNGVLAANTITAYYGRGADVIKAQLDAYRTCFKTIAVFPASKQYSLWTPQNLVVVAQAGKQRPVEEYLRYPALDLDQLR